MAWYSPARTVPITRWRSPRRWSAKPSTLVVLVIGLTLFGLGEAVVVKAGLGNGPWTVFAQGLTVRTGLAIGLTTLIISGVVLLIWIPLREKLGLGTIANAIVIAAALQVGVLVIPDISQPVIAIAAVVFGVALIGIGSGLYLTTNLGPGPRDGAMTGIHNRTGWPIYAVRLGIEVTVVIIGWLLGGTVGIGTVLFALLIGPFVGYGLMLVGRFAGTGRSAPTDSDPALEA